jgi:hypothetical protein
MRKLVTTAVGVAVLCGMTAFAQSTPSTTQSTPPTMGMMNTDQQHIMGAHRDAEFIHRAIMEGAHDPETLQLVSQALTDRTTLLQSELNRVAQLQALVTALQGGDKAAIQAARETLKTATETVVANAKTFAQDCKAIREHLQSIPHEGWRPRQGSGGTPGTTAN